MTESVTLEGGPFDGQSVCVEWGVPLILEGGEVPEGMVARYRPTRRRGVYRFREYDRVVLRVPVGGGWGMKGKRMCPNEACERFNQPTGLMGGCDCGTALVPYKTLDEQIDDAMWEVVSPTLRRLVGYGLVAEMDRQRREGRS